MLRNLTAMLGLGLLAACGDPLANVPRLSDVDVVAAPAVEAVPAPIETDDKAGLFQRLQRKRQVPADVARDPEPAEKTRRKNGFFARLVARDKVASPEQARPASLDQSGAGMNDLEVEAAAPAPARTRLFGGRKATRLTGAEDGDATPGQVLPFGSVARACHVKRANLGREVSKFPERGTKYRLYDSAPGNVALHTFYLTGFSDGCPRQFTAALAVFGSPGMHEVLRYGLPDKAKQWSETDLAYEKVKGRVCGTGRRKPCGSKLSKLEKNTVFLSIYNRFEGADGWTNLLLHDGQVLAMDQRG